MPIKSKQKPMMIKVEVIKDDTPEVYFNSLYHAFSAITYYNLRDSDDNIVTIDTRPDLFWERPYNGMDESNKYWLSENMVEHISTTYLNINWGDDDIEKILFKTRKININGEVFYYDTLQVNSNEYKHTYKNAGEYIICVYGYVDNFSIAQPVANKEQNWILKDVISWGQLNLKTLRGTLIRVMYDMDHVPKLDFNYWKNVISINWFMSNFSEGSVWNDKKQGLKIDWENIGGDDFFYNFPKLVNCSNAFYQSTVTYIPEYCFQNNPYIQNLDYCFYNCEIKYIGEYACADLKYLYSASNFYGLDRNEQRSDLADYIRDNQLFQYIGDSVFENCINLSDNINFSFLFVVNTYALNGKGWEKIGNRVFKNCKKLISQSGNNTGWLYLTEIGDEVFAGCENLENLTYMFVGAHNLKHIGKDIFKGCKKLKNLDVSFCYCCFKLNIPNRFFYDIEYQGENYNIGFYCDTQPNSNIILQYNNVLDFLRHSGTSHLLSNQECELLKELRPDLVSEMQQKYNNYKENSGFNFGKDMFNQKFLYDLGINNGRISNQFDWWDGHFDVYIYDVVNEYGDTKLVDWEFYNRNTGEAPPFWKYGIQPVKFGEIGIGVSNNGVNCHGDLRYDNTDEVPKESPWIEIYPKDYM